MKAAMFIILTCAAFFQAQISTNDFRPVLGDWKGTLTYNDYSSSKEVKISADISVSELVSDKNAIVLKYTYPKEPQANSMDTLRISADGKMINDKHIVSAVKQNDSVVLTAEKQGKDNDKPSTLRYIYTLSNSKFNIRKEVKYNDSSDFFFRNEYSFHR